MRKAAGRLGQVVIFEAEPNNFKLLQETVKKDGYKNVLLVNAAAWSETMKGTLYLSPYSWNHTVNKGEVIMDNDFRPGNENMLPIKCEFRVLDEVLEELKIPDIDFLSVTVNGTELEVLEGGKNLLSKSKRIRIYSKGHAFLSNGNPLNAEINNYLLNFGFKTKICRDEPSVFPDRFCSRRSGDVYAKK